MASRTRDLIMASCRGCFILGRYAAVLKLVLVSASLAVLTRRDRYRFTTSRKYRRRPWSSTPSVAAAAAVAAMATNACLSAARPGSLRRLTVGLVVVMLGFSA